MVKKVKSKKVWKNGFNFRIYFKLQSCLNNSQFLFFRMKKKKAALFIDGQNMLPFDFCSMNNILEKYDVIITYGPFKTGFAGYLLKKLTRAKLIIEVPGNPKKSFSFETKDPSIINKLKTKVGDLLVPFIINEADHIKLLYPTQLNGYKDIEKKQISIFHDFVPISAIKPSEESDKYILFLGFPWYLKGVDILIKAFKLISNEFPEYRLKIVGYCPDKSYFQKLAEGNNKIELCDPVFHHEAMKLMSRCTLFVLPSRTEAMGRVLLEAMACKKPPVIRDIPVYKEWFKDGENCIKGKTTEDFARAIEKLSTDSELRKKISNNAYSTAKLHDISNTIDALIKMYEALLSNAE